jgi:transposase
VSHSLQRKNGALETFQNSTDSLSEVICVLADSAYTGKSFDESVNNLIAASVEIAKRSELHTFKVIPKPWVVEPSLGRR